MVEPPLYPAVVGAMQDKGFFGFRHSPTSGLARATRGSSDSAQPARSVAALSNPSRYPAGGLNGRNDDHGPLSFTLAAQWLLDWSKTITMALAVALAGKRILI